MCTNIYTYFHYNVHRMESHIIITIIIIIIGDYNYNNNNKNRRIAWNRRPMRRTFVYIIVVKLNTILKLHILKSLII